MSYKKPYSPLRDKTMTFSVDIVNYVKELQKIKKEYIMSKQLLRSATSIGANYREGEAAQSDKDFISKLSISRKEAYESGYWLELLQKTEYLSESQFKSLNNLCTELIKMLTSAINTKKANMEK